MVVCLDPLAMARPCWAWSRTCFFEEKPLIRTDCVSNSLLLKGLFAITGAEQMTGLQQPEEEFPAQAKG